MFSIGEDDGYFEVLDDDRLNNRKILRKVADKCYLPANHAWLQLLKKHPGLRLSFSITGMAIDQFEMYAPEVLESFKELVATGRVELVNETYYHSLAFIYSRDEFERQVRMHQQKMLDVFSYETRAFRNTELIYNNEVAKAAEEMGFEVVLAEGVDRYLGWRSPNFVYKPAGTEKIKLLLKNYKLSDDIAFRFSNKDWEEWPLKAEKFADWVRQVGKTADVVNLFLDYETFGEHQWKDTGIFEFISDLPSELKKRAKAKFMTVSEAAASFEAKDEVDMPELTSWADLERDVSAWLDNSMQQTAAASLFELEKKVIKSSDKKLVEDWRKLTASDHFYYMCTKWFADGDVHKYFSPHESPYEAYCIYMNVIHDVRRRLAEVT